MNKTILLATVILISIASPAFAIDNDNESISMPMPEIRMLFKGEIAAVDKTARTIMLTSSSGKDVTVKTNDKTRYSVEGKKASFDDLEPGMRVSISYRGSAPRGVAVAIQAFGQQKGNSPTGTADKPKYKIRPLGGRKNIDVRLRKSRDIQFVVTDEADLVKKVQGIEEKISEFISKKDHEALRLLYADDIICVNLDGDVVDKETLIAKPYTLFGEQRSFMRQADQERVHVGDNIAIVTGVYRYRVTIYREDEKEDLIAKEIHLKPIRYTHAFEYRQERWQLIASQVTEIKKRGSK
jgi:ketosteroid isomerase-like protein